MSADSSGQPATITRFVEPNRGLTSCGQCLLRSLCLPDHLTAEDVQIIEEIVEQPRPLDRGEYLFRAGDTFESLFVVRAGTIKSYQLSRDGDEQVTGFGLPGELVGLDGMADGSHPSAAVALERTTVCAIPMRRFEKVAAQVTGLTHRFTRMVGKYIVAEQELLAIRSRDTAEQRLALFLLNFSDRLEARGFDGSEFSLSMPRRDLGKYLSLAVETVSRTLTRFRGSGLIEVDRRRIRLLDIEALKGVGRP